MKRELFDVSTAVKDDVESEQVVAIKKASVCMHVRGTARIDMRVLREATALLQAGFPVSVVDIEKDNTRPQIEEIEGVRVHHLFVPTPRRFIRFRVWELLVSVYQLLLVKADIYHAHDISALPACYLAALLRRKRIVLDTHELPLSDFDHGIWRWVKPLWHFGLMYILPRCSGVITVSAPIAEKIKKNYHVYHLTLLRNILPYRTTRRDNRLHQHLGLEAQVRIALYQGNLLSDRNLDGLIRAARYIEPDIVIVMLGKADSNVLEQLQQLIQKEEVQDRVKILPPVPYEELLDWTASADIGLLLYDPYHSLNVRWCLPNKLFEYIMAGLPVLSTPLEAVSEVLRRYDIGHVISSLDPEVIGKEISAMLQDRQMLARMSNNALNAARKELCWEQERERLLELYFTILRKQ